MGAVERDGKGNKVEHGEGERVNQQQKKVSRFLEKAVALSLLFTAAMIVACFVAFLAKALTEAEGEIILSKTCMVFGGELVLAMLIRFADMPWKEKKEEKRDSNG